MLLLGKCGHILVRNPSVQIEDNDDYEAAKWEHAAEETTELEIKVVTQQISEDFEVTETSVECGNADMTIIEHVQMDILDPGLYLDWETDKEILDTKKESCAYQVIVLLNYQL